MEEEKEEEEEEEAVDAMAMAELESSRRRLSAKPSADEPCQVPRGDGPSGRL